MADHKQINFTIVPDDAPGPDRQYANFCAVAHTPFDFTLTFCEVAPLSEKEIRDAEQEHLVKVKIQFAEAFEICEYGRRPNPQELKKLFPFFGE